MELQQTRYEVSNGVARITLDRPEQLNAFTTRMMHELLGIIDEVNRDDSVRVAILTGSGRAFCAGADLSAGGSSFDPGQGYGPGDDERQVERNSRKLWQYTVPELLSRPVRSGVHCFGCTAGAGSSCTGTLG